MMAHLGSLIGSDDLPDPDLESVSSFSLDLLVSPTENQGMILAFAGGGRCVSSDLSRGTERGRDGARPSTSGPWRTRRTPT